MASHSPRRRKPAITITRSDDERLQRLANSILERNPELAETLLSELDRAQVVTDARIRPDVIRMGSTVRYSTETGEERTVTLVYPNEADIAEGRISVLTPIGIALIGLSSGQAMDWTARDGRVHRLTVLDVAGAEQAPELRTA